MLPENNPDFNEFLSHLSANAKESLKIADQIAKDTGSAYIGTEHLLLGILSNKNSTAYKLLLDLGIVIDAHKMSTTLNNQSNVLNMGAKGLSATAKLTLRTAYEITQELNLEIVGTEHILYSILSQKSSRGTLLLKDISIDTDLLFLNIGRFINHQQFMDNMTKMNNFNRFGTKNNQTSILATYGIDLTQKAKENKLDPLIGRDKEIKRLITILSRRLKNNPVLIGEPGVGKTAIVEGLAQKIVHEDVPEILLDKKIIMIDLAALVAGTKYRGEFEDRLKKVLDELEKNKNIIAFIDEIHLIVGTGSAEGSMDAGNILKPALARKKIQLIGSTTTEEYTKYIERDSALERRFQSVIVGEPTTEETIQILKGLVHKYEKFHQIKIPEDVLEETVLLAKRYLFEKYMPDKAIDLLDESAANLKIENLKSNPEVRKINKEIKLITFNMNEAVDQQNYELAAKYKVQIAQLNQKIKDLTKNESAQNDQLVLTVEDVAKIISRITGIPVTKVIKSEAKYILNLDKIIAKRLIGQNEAILEVVKAIKRNRSGISNPNRPIGSFLFLGPTGVGKTELARLIAREYFGTEKALIKIDMSEFSEHHNVSRLVGAPAGYIGYENEGDLTDKIRHQPYSLVLFDEIEKAHPDFSNILLQILEDGVLTDAKGRRIDFRNTIIIMTSNIGAEKLQKDSNFGFGLTDIKDVDHDLLHQKNEQETLKELRKLLKPELINRLDKIIVFKNLTKNMISKIIDIQIDQLNLRLNHNGIIVDVDNKAKKYLLEHGYDLKNGVRPLRRLIENTIEDFIASNILEDKIQTGDIIKVSASNDQLKYLITNESKIKN